MVQQQVQEITASAFEHSSLEKRQSESIEISSLLNIDGKHDSLLANIDGIAHQLVFNLKDSL